MLYAAFIISHQPLDRSAFQLTKLSSSAVGQTPTPTRFNLGFAECGAVRWLGIAAVLSGEVVMRRLYCAARLKGGVLVSPWPAVFCPLARYMRSSDPIGKPPPPPFLMDGASFASLRGVGSRCVARNPSLSAQSATYHPRFQSIGKFPSEIPHVCRSSCLCSIKTAIPFLPSITSNPSLPHSIRPPIHITFPQFLLDPKHSHSQ